MQRRRKGLLRYELIESAALLSLMLRGNIRLPGTALLRYWHS